MTVLDDILDLLARPAKRAQRRFEKLKFVFEIAEWWRKTIGTLTYCGGKKWIYTAWTYEENETDRKLWLQAQLDSDIEDKCGFGGQGSELEVTTLTGYELLEVNESEVDQLAVYDSWDFSRTPAK